MLNTSLSEPSRRLPEHLALVRSPRPTIGPSFDIDASGSSVYRPRGTDTLQWGDAEVWAAGKFLLSGVDQLRFALILGGMNADDLARQALQDLTEQLALLRAQPGGSPVQRATETAESFVALVEDALAHEQPQLAETYAQQGHRLYPEHARLAKLAWVLAPARTVATNLPPDPTVGLNLAWLKAHRAEYVGQWVAVKAGELQGVAASLRELKPVVGDLRGMMVTRVL